MYNFQESKAQTAALLKSKYAVEQTTYDKLLASLLEMPRKADIDIGDAVSRPVSEGVYKSAGTFRTFEQWLEQHEETLLSLDDSTRDEVIRKARKTFELSLIQQHIKGA